MSSEMRFIKWVRFFERNCIVKWVIFFGSFCWLWDFLLKNLKLKKLWWCLLTRVDEYNKFVCPKKYFQKNNFKYEILSNLCFGPNFVFLGNALGVLARFFFFNFSTSASHDGRYFYSAPSPPPTLEKLPTALWSDDYYFGVTKNTF